MNRMCEFFGWQRGGAKEVRARTRLRQVKLDRRSWFEPKYSDKGDNVLDVLQHPECQRSPVLETSEQIDVAVSCPNNVSTSGPTIAASEQINLAVSCPVVRMSGPIDLFFSQYQEFNYDPHSRVWTEFRRLCGFFAWLKGSPAENAARNLFRQALVDEFGAIYGENDEKVDVLQQLCRKLEIDPIPQSITACKKAIKGVYVNIIDFIDCERTGEPIHKFASLAHLRRYTKKTGKFFPREQAKRSLLLRFLLQVLFGRKKSQ
ncbi:hypothetical protein E4U13_001816 [Claviceps humidiphila]|uniref:Uncharacterized protein n=1 Tax=Claviceps humidiphila TaxID=1294629 RepID=A0A9P7Q322_9HYPO|nr:hypothetical protein E4U13_001816 [Claviceps humidiphila]